MAKDTDNKEVKATSTNEYEQVIEELKNKLNEAETSNERLRISLELQEKKAEAKDPSKPSGIEYGPSFNPANVLDKVGVPYAKKEPDKQFRYISTHPTVYALRRGQGYEPVLDEKGVEVRQGDTVLAKMPKERFNEEIVMPRKETKVLRKEAIETRFHEQGKDLGIKTFGQIIYDTEKSG